MSFENIQNNAFTAVKIGLESTSIPISLKIGQASAKVLNETYKAMKESITSDREIFTEKKFLSTTTKADGGYQFRIPFIRGGGKNLTCNPF